MVNTVQRAVKRYRLRLLSQTENLEIVRTFVGHIARRVGFDDEDATKIEMAVDEACSNVIKHAYERDAHKPMDIAVQIDYDKLTVVVTDHGKGFDPSSIKMPDMKEYLAELRVGGLGIYLMRTLMDEVTYDIKPGVRNQVRMVKYFIKRNSPSLPGGSSLKKAKKSER